jgi:hypothetical protein
MDLPPHFGQDLALVETAIPQSQHVVIAIAISLTAVGVCGAWPRGCRRLVIGIAGGAIEGQSAADDEVQSLHFAAKCLLCERGERLNEQWPTTFALNPRS